MLLIDPSNSLGLLPNSSVYNSEFFTLYKLDQVTQGIDNAIPNISPHT